MTLYAVDAIDDAIEATREFLWPFDLGRWARLALVVFFVGTGGGFSPFQFTGGTPSGGGSESPTAPGAPDVPPEAALPGGAELAVIAAIAGIIIALGLLFLLVGSIMEFVLVESLRREEVTVRRYWSERWRQGARLFVFRVLLGILTLAVVGLILAGALWPVLFGDGGLSVGLLFVAVPAFALVTILSGLVGGFTTMFVVPVMIAEDRSVLSAWRRFWPVVTAQWKQYAAYAVLGFVLQIAAGILASIATLFAAVVIAIPLVVVGVVGFALLSAAELVGWAIIAVAAALFVLALVEPAFDLIAERRAAVREEPSPTSGAGHA